MAQFGNITNSGKAKISSKYGPRNIGPGRSRNHKGIDIAYPSGTAITSPLDGVVERAASSAPKCGGLIVINHGEFNGKKVKSKYCHVKKINVNKNQEVTKGQIVGISGGAKGDPGRGNSTGAHIHFEIYENGVNVDPTPYYQNSPSGTQSQLPSKSDLEQEEPEQQNGKVDIDTETETSGTPKERARDIAKNLLLKLFGVGEPSTVTADVVTEVERYRELMSEQTPTILNNQTTDNCPPYNSPIGNCKSRKEENGGITWVGNNENSIIKTETTGKIEVINKGNWGNGYKIGNKEYFWNGTFTKTTGTTVSANEQIGTGGILFIRNSGSNQPPKNSQQSPINSITSSMSNSNNTKKDYKSQARDIASGLVGKLMGVNQTQAPQTNAESIEKLKNTISEEIKMFNKLIK